MTVSNDLRRWAAAICGDKEESEAMRSVLMAAASRLEGGALERERHRAEVDAAYETIATLRARVTELESERLDIFDAGEYFSVRIALSKFEAQHVRMATEDWIILKIRASLSAGSGS